ncbi:MAG TPA: GPR1/FUN34/YaaH family transporter [Methylomirabilota bacterium]
MRDVTSVSEPTADRIVVGSNRIAVPWVLGLYALAGATFIVAARMAGWYGGSESRFLLLPFAAVLGGLTQLLAGMWAFEAEDTLATAMLGIWGSFWIGYGILQALFLSGRLVEPTGPFRELGFWFIPLALITWVGAAAARSAALAVTLVFLAAGASIAAIANISMHGGLMILAGWLFIISSVLAWYTATAMMFETTSGHQVWPLGRLRSWRLPRTTTMPGPASATHRAG